MNTVFCKCVLAYYLEFVLISTFPGMWYLESQKIISVQSCCLIRLVEIPGIISITSMLVLQEGCFSCLGVWPEVQRGKRVVSLGNIPSQHILVKVPLRVHYGKYWTRAWSRG